MRARLETGELQGLPPINLGNGLVLRDVELAVWIMLADVGRYAAVLPELRQRPVIAAGAVCWRTTCGGCASRCPTAMSGARIGRRHGPDRNDENLTLARRPG